MDSQLHRKWEEKILLMLNGPTKTLSSMLVQRKFLNGGTKPYELQLPPHAFLGHGVPFVCRRICRSEGSSQRRRALEHRDCAINRLPDPGHWQECHRPVICR